MFEAKNVATLLDTLGEVVNLEQEENVAFVYFLVVPHYKTDDFIFEFGVLWLVVSASFDLSAVQHVLKKSVVKVDCGQLIQLSRIFLSVSVYDFL